MKLSDNYFHLCSYYLLITKSSEFRLSISELPYFTIQVCYGPQPRVYGFATMPDLPCPKKSTSQLWYILAATLRTGLETQNIVTKSRALNEKDGEELLKANGLRPIDVHQNFNA
jgi:hypothetical protein